MDSSYEFYTTSKEAWNAMLESCRQAVKSIDMEQYIFADDEIGRKFLEIFRRKAGEGVRVRLLMDAAGSYGFYKSSIPPELTKLGIELRFFNIISPWRIRNFFSWFFRNHRKTLIVDDNIGFTGGVGIGDYMKNWRDTSGKIGGEIVKEMSESFLEMWNLSNDKNLSSRLRKWRALKKHKNFITNAPYFKKRFLHKALIRAINCAEESILITNPYFVPDHHLTKILRRAALRKVDVQIILPDKIDVLLLATASHASFFDLLKRGVRIFKYQPEVLHAKTLVIDDAWATYVSFNFDNRSFYYNYEANLVSEGLASIQALKRHFQEDLKHCREITLSEWRKRPLLQKIIELLVSPIRGIL